MLPMVSFDIIVPTDLGLANKQFILQWSSRLLLPLLVMDCHNIRLHLYVGQFLPHSITFSALDLKYFNWRADKSFEPMTAPQMRFR